ncbi:tetratricopeptide repeat protein [Streptomyces sp. AK02-01A]|uniref:tetratricopeptide repeat protein n=1 Tax=Streptomyces sp. AK02-01A TaxID=3028648 RepID=UPI0029BA86A4|nr:tetratricopeptide repeat protein [Streptomyces sp. AK02-01A]MDX3849308.1 tetratricopeptide repeat protein [Streptomyces sp. AK02-01A]
MDVAEFTGAKQVADRAAKLVGTPCPLCEVTIRRGEVDVAMDSEHLELIKDKRSIWNTPDRTVRGYEGFTKDEARPARSSSAVAKKLRGQVSDSATARRRERCEAGTRALLAMAATYLGDPDGTEAPERTRNALRAITWYGDSDAAAGAALQLGMLEQSDGNLDEALRLFRRAVETADGVMKPTAYRCLGAMLDHLGDTEGAKDAFRRCVDCGESSSLAQAAYRLGNLLRLTDPLAARAVYDMAVRTGHKEYAPLAAVNLGVIEEDEGNQREAKRRWKYAFAHGGTLERTVAAFNLARTWEREGRIRKARTYYLIAVDSPEPEAARRAREYLADGS